MANESKKFALFACCLMTMQALRLVISTAGFCVVRFHIDCELFNIFISRLVNAVLMSQLFGNWLGDLIVFAASGQLKLYAIAFANWAEFICFCSALGCFCSGEQGMLNGFYWSMVIAYFWWKVGEAPTISIGVDEVDWYFAGFTLSGVWAAMLKSVTMMFITNEKGIHSEVLGEVNVTVVGDLSVVGARSVKTTVDYRAAKSLFAIVIVVTALMCLIWDAIQVAVNDTGRRGIVEALKAERGIREEKTATLSNSENQLAKVLKDLTNVKVTTAAGGQKTLNFTGATVEKTGVQAAQSGPESEKKIDITVGGVTKDGSSPLEGSETIQAGTEGDKIKAMWIGQSWASKIKNVTGSVEGGNLKLTVEVNVAKDREEVFKALEKAASERSYKLKVSATDNRLLEKIKAGAGSQSVNVAGSQKATLTFTNATVDPDWDVDKAGPGGLEITVRKMQGATTSGAIDSNGEDTKKTADRVKTQLGKMIGGAWKITGVTLSGNVKQATAAWDLNVSVSTVDDSGGMTGDNVVAKALAVASGVVMGAIFAVPGALTFATFGKWCKCGTVGLKAWGFTGSVLGFLGGGFGLGYFAWDGATEGDTWVPFFKWGKGEWGKEDDPNKAAVRVAALIGLVVGTLMGAFVGLCIGSCTGSKKRGTAAGAFIGGFVGLWSGEIYNGHATWSDTTGFVVRTNGAAKGNEQWVVICGYFIVVAGLGTVYSIYPGMAPCSITQFKYFNIIDIWILILSSIGPIVITGVDLAEAPTRFGKTILLGRDNGTPDGEKDGQAGWRMWSAIVVSVLMTIATLICEIIVLDMMQHPFSKTAQKVTTSGWRACTLTILMVSFQLTSTGIGFACVAAGSGFNDGVYNALSTLVLWTMECCGVLGEGYLTELKKYEPGKWPTQGMGKWATYKWWNRKTFGNAWQIWCCIGTTDLRRDIMLCRQ